MAKINETLRQLRLDRGMTQEEVAEQVGLTRQAVSSYESGRTQPGLDILERLAQVYEVELADVIYGRNQGIRLYNGLKITAIVMTCVFLAAQLACSVLMWIANRFFSLAPGQMSDADRLTWVSRANLMDAWEAVEGLYYGLFPLCCVALLVLTLCLRRPLIAKVKALSALSFVAASMVVVLPWALTDPFYPPVNYLITPGLCLLELLFFLLLSLIVDFFRTRKYKQDASSAELQEERAEPSGTSVFRRWWFWGLMGAAVLLLLLLLVVSVFGGSSGEVPPVENPAFTLNGVEYPSIPILQDFVDRGWKVRKPYGYTGTYSEEAGVSNLTVSSCTLKSGGNHVTVYLNREDLANGVERNQCRIKSLSLYGSNVMSFTVDNSELSQITRAEIEESWGEPYKVDGDRTLFYMLPDVGSRISFTFKNATAAVGQIMMQFEFDPEWK